MDALPERIRSKICIDPTREYEGTPCWHYLGKWNSGNGYSKVWWLGRSAQVHRVTYTLLVGPIDVGLLLDHRCRNRACCNPAHLKPETVKVNTLIGEACLFRRAEDYPTNILDKNRDTCDMGGSLEGSSHAREA